MVEEVKAYRDSKGSLHQTKDQALQAEALEEILKLQIFNHPSATAIVTNAHVLSDILYPLVTVESSR